MSPSVFKKTCAKCHKHGDIGEKIGPELTGFAVHPKEKILTEIIDPNRSVEGNYRLYTVTTDAGRIYNGLLATCLAAPKCKTFVSWGFTDKVSWIPSAFPGYGAALPFDQNYNPKPAYFGLRAGLGG